MSPGEELRRLAGELGRMADALKRGERPLDVGGVAARAEALVLAGRAAALGREQLLRESAVSAQRLAGLLHVAGSGMTWSTAELVGEGDHLLFLLGLLREGRPDVGRAA